MNLTITLNAKNSAAVARLYRSVRGMSTHDVVDGLVELALKHSAKPAGRPRTVTEQQLAVARYLREGGDDWGTIAESVGVNKNTLRSLASRGRL